MRDEAHSEYQLSLSLVTAANPTQKMCSKPEPVDGVQHICSLQGHARASKTHNLMVKTLSVSLSFSIHSTGVVFGAQIEAQIVP